MAESVAVALSGGVDSAVSAALLIEQGWDVIGVTMRLPQPAEALAPGSCCGEIGIRDARRVAESLGIYLLELDCRTFFDYYVVETLCDAYARGETPNPCVRCNRYLKFGYLLDVVRSQGITYLASGHYANVQLTPAGWPVLSKGADAHHDQSYFLYDIAPERLQQLLFPLSKLTKQQVRQIAAQRQLPVAAKPGSQDICFVGEGGYTALLESRRPEALVPGPIEDRAGRVLGQHRGVGRYTLGQREGLGIAAPRPLYVVAINAVRNTLVVAPQEEALIQELSLERVRWLLEDVPPEPVDCGVKPRYRSPELPATVTALPGERALLRFRQAQPPAAPGQSAVFYDGDRVTGGGIIAETRATH